MPSLSTDRVRKSRALHAASGSKRVEIVLGPDSRADLEAVMGRLSLKQSDAIAYAVSYVADIVTARK